MATPLSCLKKFIVPQQSMLVHLRHKHKFKTKNPRPKPMPRRVYAEVTKPIVSRKETYLNNSCLDPDAQHNKPVEENPYEDFLIRYLQKEIDSSEMVIICHRQPCSPLRYRAITVALKKQGMKFSVTNNKHMRLVTENSKLANMESLLTSHSGRITCTEPKIKELVSTMRKFPEMVILGGFVSDRLVTKESLIEYSKLPSIEQLRGELVSCLNTGGGAKTLSLLNSHQQKLTCNLQQYKTQLEESD